MIASPKFAMRNLAMNLLTTRLPLAAFFCFGDRLAPSKVLPKLRSW